MVSKLLSFSIIMEYADNGDLLNLIKNSREEGVYLKEDVIWTIFIQILRGVSALHNLDIIHRDLKVTKEINSVC